MTTETKKPTKAAETAESTSSFYGTSVEILCSDPSMEMEKLIAALAKKGLKYEDGKSSVRTAYAQVRKVVSLLKANKLMK